MSRFTQKPSPKGSQRWIQKLVNLHPNVLDDAIGIGRIEWLSPLASDDYAEYRDEEFLDCLGIKSLKQSLSSYWPSGGPQWDALGRAESGEMVLVECKAHLKEVFSPPTQASGSSLNLIKRSLEETKMTLAASPGMDWSIRFYQYANRIAHARYLQNLNDIPTKMVFLYIVGDSEMNGPSTRAEWETAIAVLHEALGIKDRVPNYVRDAYVDVSTGSPIAC